MKKPYYIQGTATLYYSAIIYAESESEAAEIFLEQDKDELFCEESCLDLCHVEEIIKIDDLCLIPCKIL